MRISLINPPFVLEEYYRRLGRVGSVQQPLGLGYLGAVLKQAGHRIQILDAPALRQTPQRTLGTLKRFHPDLVGITSTTPGYGKARLLARLIREETETPLVIGGPHVTAIPNETITQDSFNMGVIGEGERTLLELANKMEKGDSWKEVHGIVYKEDGEVRRTTPRPYIENLDDLPFPARELMPPLDSYHPTPSAYRLLPQATMITSRGCPYKCTFCDRAVFGNQYRARSPRNVVDEMELVVHRHGAKEVRFWDDTFNVDRQRVIGISQEIVRRKLDVSWTCVVRINPMNREVLRAIASAGCWQVEYGIESGSQTILNRIKKGLTTDLVRRVTRITKEEGINIRGFFMLGLPGETQKTMTETIRFAKSLDLDVAVFHITIPFPGTELYRQALETGELRTDVDYGHYLMFSSEDFPYVPGGLTRKILRAYQKKAYLQFYLRPSYLLERLADIRGLEDVRRYLTGLLAVTELA